jgi:hypothetical protein
MKDSFSPKERRSHRRIMMSFPVNLGINEYQGIYGLTINASESGLLIQTLKNMPLKTTLNIEVVSPKGFELSNFKALAEIVWKDICNWEDLEGYQYGLKFIQISDENYSILKKLVGDSAFLKKAQLVESPEHDATLVVKVK